MITYGIVAAVSFLLGYAANEINRWNKARVERRDRLGFERMRDR
jgi:hypothetical protein